MRKVSFFSTFASGVNEVVLTALKEQIKDAKIELALDGLVVYKTQRSIVDIQSIRFFNNSFILLHLFPKLTDEPIRSMTKQVLKNPDLISEIPKTIFKNTASFRIVTSQENQLVSLDHNLLRKLERLFSEITELAVDRANPDLEVWFLSRREGYGFVGLRITHTPNYEKILEKGELRPELANILCLISKPQKDDIFLDPFTGSGAIPLERAKSFPYQKIIAADNDQGVFAKLQAKMQKTKEKIIVECWDALKLKAITNQSVNKIVTDPPWGFYAPQKMNLEKFYTKMMEEFIRITKIGGLMVILMAQKEFFEKVLQKFSGKIVLLKKYNILVSGKKAAIYKIKRSWE